MSHPILPPLTYTHDIKNYLPDPVVVQEWPLNPTECTMAIQVCLSNYSSVQEITKLILSEKFVLLLFASYNQKYFNAITHGHTLVPLNAFLASLAFPPAVVAAIPRKDWDDICKLDIFMLLCCFAAKTTGTASVARQITVAHNASKIPIPTLIANLQNFLCKNEVADNYNTGLWRFEDEIKDLMTLMLKENKTDKHGREIQVQARKTMENAQMFFASEIQHILHHDTSNLKVQRTFIDELTKLSEYREEFEAQNYPKYLKFHHTKLFRLINYEKIQASEFPFCCAVVQYYDNKKRGNARRPLKLKVNPIIMNAVNRYASEPLPIGYTNISPCTCSVYN